MPEIGEIRKAHELGYSGRALYVWFSCPVCGKLRWMYNSLKGTLCLSCAAQQRARKLLPITFVGSREPKIGDTASAKWLGYKERGVRTYDACPKCNQGHWVRHKDIGTLCIHCVAKPKGSAHPRWCGGHVVKKGYAGVLVEKNDPLHVMAQKGNWVLEHRLLMARSLGRPLTKDEVVHHINGNKHDNRIENLQLLTRYTHNSNLVSRTLQNRLTDLESRMTQVEAENVLLRAALQEIRDSVPGTDSILQRYNTPSGHPLIFGVTEGIVQSLSNEEKPESA